MENKKKEEEKDRIQFEIGDNLSCTIVILTFLIAFILFTYIVKFAP